MIWWNWGGSWSMAYNEVPRGRSMHTMTCVNQSAAWWYVQESISGIVHAWRQLGLGPPQGEATPWSILNLVPPIWRLGQQSRPCSRTAEPISKGHDSNTSAIQKMAFNVVPLKILAMEVTTGVTNENDLRLEKDKCPKRLKEETEAHRNRIWSQPQSDKKEEVRDILCLKDTICCKSFSGVHY